MPLKDYVEIAQSASVIIASIVAICSIKFLAQCAP